MVQRLAMENGFNQYFPPPPLGVRGVFGFFKDPGASPTSTWSKISVNPISVLYSQSLKTHIEESFLPKDKILVPHVGVHENVEKRLALKFKPPLYSKTVHMVNF